jgi:hypothetical protein
MKHEWMRDERWMDGWMDDMVQINFKIAQLGQIHKVENPKTLKTLEICAFAHTSEGFFVVRLLSTAELFFGCCLHKGRTRAGKRDLPFGTLNF